MNNNIILFLLIIGLFFPTSLSAEIKNFQSVYSVILILVLLWSLIRRKYLPKIPLLIFLGINFVLLLATWITPFNEYAVGSYLAYLSLSILFLLGLKNNRFTESHIRIFKWINIIIIILGFLVINQNQIIIDFFIQNYSYYYEDLVRFASYTKKPVIMFASHSIAAFYFYIFFYLCLESYKKTKQLSFLFISISYVVLMLYLNSFTTHVFLIIATIQIIKCFLPKKPVVTVMTLVLSCLIFRYRITDLYQSTQNAFLSESNGLIGRFKSTGYQAQNLDYISENFYRPVGFGYSDDLFFGDSGMVEVLLRGSLLLFILIYAGVFLFYKSNLILKRDAIFLFLIFMMMEIGYTTFIYFRSLFIIPFILVYINSIRSLDETQLKKGSKFIRKRKRIVWSH
jgi:hypothetical protein